MVKHVKLNNKNSTKLAVIGHSVTLLCIVDFIAIECCTVRHFPYLSVHLYGWNLDLTVWYGWLRLFMMICVGDFDAARWWCDAPSLGLLIWWFRPVLEWNFSTRFLSSLLEMFPPGLISLTIWSLSCSTFGDSFSPLISALLSSLILCLLLLLFLAIFLLGVTTSSSISPVGDFLLDGVVIEGEAVFVGRVFAGLLYYVR